MNRRSFIASTISTLYLSWQGAFHRAWGASDERVSIRWSVHRDRLEPVKKGLRWEGKIEPDLTSRRDTRGLPILYILVGALGLSQLAKSLIGVAKDYRHGGLMVDARGEDLVIKDLPTLDRGTILVVSDKGEKIFRPESGFDMSAFLQSLKNMR